MSEPTPKMSGTRSEGVDLLRGIAVLMVMLAHAPFMRREGAGTSGSGGVYPPMALSSLVGDGRHGVELFLVISGYCIHSRWARRAASDERVAFFSFWKRRLIRLYPPYAFVLAACVTMTLLAAYTGLTPRIIWRQFALDVGALVFLVQNATEASAHVGNGPFWSLALEEHLYLLYFPLLYLRRRWGWHVALLVPVLAFAGWATAGLFLDFATNLASSGENGVLVLVLLGARGPRG